MAGPKKQAPSWLHLAVMLSDAGMSDGDAEELARFAFEHDDYGWNQRRALEQKRDGMARSAQVAQKNHAALERVIAKLPAPEEVEAAGG